MGDWKQPASFPVRTAPPKTGLRVAERFKVEGVEKLEDGGQEGPFPNQHPRVKIEGKPQEKEHFLSIQIIVPAATQEKLSKIVSIVTASWSKASFKPINKSHLHITLAGDLVGLWGLKSKKEKKVEDEVLAEVKKRTKELIDQWLAKTEGKAKPKLRWSEVTISKSDLNCEVEGNEAMLGFYEHIKTGTNQKWELYQKSTTVMRYLLPQRSENASLSQDDFDKLVKDAKAELKANLIKTEKLTESCQEGFPAEHDITQVWLTNGDYLADSYDILETYSLESTPKITGDWKQPASFPLRTPAPKTGIRVAERFKIEGVEKLEDGGQEGPFPNQHPRVKIEGKPQEKEHFLSIQIIVPAVTQARLAKIISTVTAGWPNASFKAINTSNLHITLAGDLVALWGLKSKKEKKVEDEVLAEVKKKTKELIDQWLTKTEGKAKPKLRWTEVTISKCDLNCEVEGNEAMLGFYDHIKTGTNQKWELYQKSTSVLRYLLPQRSDHSSLSQDEFDKLVKDAKAELKANLIKAEKTTESCQDGFPAEHEITQVWLTNGDYLADSYDILETYSLEPSTKTTSDWKQPASFPLRTSPPKTGIRVAERFKIDGVEKLKDGGQEGPFPNQHPRVKIEGKAQEKEHFLSIQIIVPATTQSKLEKIISTVTSSWPKASFKAINTSNLHITLAGDLVALWGLKSKKEKKVEDEVLAEVKKKTKELIDQWLTKTEGKTKPKLRWTEVTISKCDLNCEVEGNEAMLGFYEHVKTGTNQKWELYQKSTSVLRYLLPQRSEHASLTQDEFDKLVKDAKAELKANLIKAEKTTESCQDGFPAEHDITQVWLTNGDYLADSYDILETYSLEATTPSPTLSFTGDWKQPASFPVRTTPPKAGIRVAERFKVDGVEKLEDGGQEGPFPNQHPRIITEGKPQDKEHFLSIQIILPSAAQEKLAKIVSTVTAGWPTPSFKAIPTHNLHLTLAGDLVAIWGLKSKKGKIVEEEVLVEVKKRTKELIDQWVKKTDGKAKPKMRWTEIAISKCDLNCEVEGNDAMLNFYEHIKVNTNQKWELYQKSTTAVRYLLPQRSAHSSLSQDEFDKLVKEAKAEIKTNLIKAEKLTESCQEGLPAEHDIAQVWLTNGDYVADSYDIVETYSLNAS